MTLKLDKFEVETLFSLIHERVVDYKHVKRMDLEVKEITQAEYDWYKGHAEYLESIADKIRSQLEIIPSKED